MSGKKSDDGREWTGTDLVDRHKVVLALDRIKMRGDETWYDYYHKALDAIAKLPPVDAVPVRRGKWIDKYPNQNVVCRVFYCSECGKSFMVGLGLSYEEWTEDRNFCEKCGADMREVSDD